jgi:NAD(P)-dependent dehydrogenase (short-subunit alcohol dehydrogenase family)
MRKVALVTGGSRGIGAATSMLLARNGFDVCINYKNNSAKAEQLLTQLRNYNSNCIAIQADISDEEQVVALFNQIDIQLGTIGVLVNNAGILKKQAPITELSAARINDILTNNVTSAFLCCREAVKRMSTKRGGVGGSIVNVSSAASRLGAPGEYIDYAASKGALDSLTIGLSKEVAAQGIRVNCVRPGFIYTNMHSDGGEPDRVDRIAASIPMQRGGQPEEVAQAIYWLLSENASYVTGTFIDAAGGR